MAGKLYKQALEGIGSLGKGFVKGIGRGVQGADEVGRMISRRAQGGQQRATQGSGPRPDRRAPDSLAIRKQQRDAPMRVEEINNRISQIRMNLMNPDFHKNKGQMEALAKEMEMLTQRKKAMLQARDGFHARQQNAPQPGDDWPQPGDDWDIPQSVREKYRAENLTDSQIQAREAASQSPQQQVMTPQQYQQATMPPVDQGMVQKLGRQTDPRLQQEVMPVMTKEGNPGYDARQAMAEREAPVQTDPDSINLRREASLNQQRKHDDGLGQQNDPRLDDELYDSYMDLVDEDGLAVQGMRAERNTLAGERDSLLLELDTPGLSPSEKQMIRNRIKELADQLKGY